MTDKYKDLRYYIGMNDKYPFDAGIEARILGAVPALLSSHDAQAAEIERLRVMLKNASSLLDDASEALEETEEACFTIIHETASMAEYIRAALGEKTCS